MSSFTRTRGNVTRDAIIRSATEIFGRVGYNAASTRAISQAAETNQALINYHFGCKEGLYRAVVDTIVSELENSLAPLLNEVEAEMPIHGRAATEAMMRIFTSLMQQFYSEDASGWWRIISREQQDPTPEFEVIYSRYLARLLQTLAVLILGASEGVVHEKAARTRAVLMLGQVLMLVFSREATRRFLEWSDPGGEISIEVLSELRQIVDAQFPEAMA